MNEFLEIQDAPIFSYAIASGDMRYIEIGERHGIGGFYNDLASSVLVTDGGYEENYGGAEAFYNFAITPAARLSTNIQYLPSVEPDVDDSTLISARLQFVF